VFIVKFPVIVVVYVATSLMNRDEYINGWLGSRRRRAWVVIGTATLSGDSLRQTVHTHRTSVPKQ